MPLDHPDLSKRSLGAFINRFFAFLHLSDWQTHVAAELAERAPRKVKPRRRCTSRRHCPSR